MGRQIPRPGEVAPGCQVLIALPTPMAEQVRARLVREAPSVNWLVPPLCQGIRQDQCISRYATSPIDESKRTGFSNEAAPVDPILRNSLT
mgnify:CR=1 FL=1